MVKLDKDNDNPAYLCGRLMFTLENAQRAAIPGIEQRTLTNSYYGSASTAPRMVFSHLMKLSRHHLTKLQRDNKGAAISIEREIEEIVGKIDPVPPVFRLCSTWKDKHTSRSGTTTRKRMQQ